MKLYNFGRQTIILEHEKQIKDLHDIMYAMELRFSERETEAKHEFESLIDEIKNKVCFYQCALFPILILGLAPGGHPCFECSA